MTQPLPEGEGAARCMRIAMQPRARSRPDQIDYINAHGTSTPIGDVCETKAIKQALGESASKAMISSTKSMTGHLRWARPAGSSSRLAPWRSNTGSCLPRSTSTTPILNAISTTSRTPRARRKSGVMTNSFGFGGHNATLIASEFSG